MMKHVAAALALTSLTGVAQASPQFPAEMLGTWCAMEHNDPDAPNTFYYGRKSVCDPDKKLVVSPTGFSENNTACRFTKIRPAQFKNSFRYEAVYAFVAKCKNWNWTGGILYAKAQVAEGSDTLILT